MPETSGQPGHSDLLIEADRFRRRREDDADPGAQPLAGVLDQTGADPLALHLFGYREVGEIAAINPVGERTGHSDQRAGAARGDDQVGPPQHGAKPGLVLYRPAGSQAGLDQYRAELSRAQVRLFRVHYLVHEPAPRYPKNLGINVPGTINGSMTTIFKILPRKEWLIAREAELFAGSGIDHRDGYIHFSTAAQAQETARLHFRNQADLVVLEIDAATLDLVWEPSRGGALFPHLYGTLPTSLVTAVHEAPLDTGGVPVFVPGGSPLK